MNGPPESAGPARPTSDVSARVAWADDAPAIAGVQARAWRASYDGVLPASTLETLDSEELTATWHAALTSPPDARFRILVALDRHRVVGYCLTSPSPDPDADPVSVGEFGDLTVDPGERRQGHGSRLLQAAVDTLVADRFTLAQAWLNASDDDLRRFLTEAGWETDGAHRTLDLTGDGTTTVRQIRMHTAIGAA